MNQHQDWDDDNWDTEDWDGENSANSAPPSNQAAFQQAPNFVVGLLLSIFLPTTGFTYIGMLKETLLWVGVIAFFGVAFSFLLSMAGLMQNIIAGVVGVVGLVAMTILHIVHYVMAYKQRAAVDFYPDLQQNHKIMGFVAGTVGLWVLSGIIFFVVGLLTAAITSSIIGSGI